MHRGLLGTTSYVGVGLIHAESQKGRRTKLASFTREEND